MLDSHVNAYVRFRWALTEDAPVIKPYDEKEWARLPDATSAPVAVSLDLLDALHTRWLILLRAMAPEDFERRWTSPDFGELGVDVLLQIYAWHGKHHAAHITALREREAPFTRRPVQYRGPRHSRTPPVSRNMLASMRSAWVIRQDSIFLVYSRWISA